MKEFMLKHPIITFLLANSAICGVLKFGNNILKMIAAGKGIEITETVETEATKEEKKDEPAGDIQ